MENSSKRLLSIDALRGFDMFWIMGAPGIVLSLNNILGGTTSSWFVNQMEHVPWDGFHFMDLVFPLFLFIAGVSFPFSLAKRREKQESSSIIYRHLLKRTLTLIFLGLVYNEFLKFDFHTFRYASVLAHIGLAWFMGALIYMHTKHTYTRCIWILGIVLSYGLLNLFVLSPHAIGLNPFSVENNIVAQFDRWFLPGVLYGGNFDPEGLLSLVPSVATALLGMLSGEFLRRNSTKTSNRKAFVLFFVGIGLIALSLLSNQLIPFNKALWSNSFVLLTGGLSISLLSVFYWIIDVHHFVKWSFFFRVIGMNSITIYMAQRIINFSEINSFFLSGIASKLSVPYGSLVMSCGYVACCWLSLYFLYKKGVFLKI